MGKARKVKCIWLIPSLSFNIPGSEQAKLNYLALLWSHGKIKFLKPFR